MNGYGSTTQFQSTHYNLLGDTLNTTRGFEIVRRVRSVLLIIVVAGHLRPGTAQIFSRNA